MIILQKCDTSSWKALDVSFKMISEQIFCGINIFLGISENVRQGGEIQSLHVENPSSQ